MRIFVGMANTQASARSSSRTRNRLTTRSVSIPQSRAENNELRELLESYLLAMQALLEEHQRTLERSLQSASPMRAGLLAELRELADHRAPWVTAIAETRALLYVALREIIVGDNDAGLSIHLTAQPKNDGQARS